jgi:acetolactate synthase-1/2/3 large subunit
MIFRPELLPEAIRRAFRIMYSGRPGPVLLDICFDVWLQEVNAEVLTPRKYRPTYRVRGDPETIREAAEMLVNAQSPSMLVGGGVLASEASPELLELAELLKIPVATTFMGKSSFPEDHPLALGVSGMAGHRVPMEILRKDRTDVLLAIGTVFHGKATYKWAKDFGGHKLIQVDIDPTEVGKNYPIDIGIVGDAKLVLRDISDHIKKLLGKKKPKEWRKLRSVWNQRVGMILKLKDELKYYAEPEMFSDAIPMKPQRALKELRRFLDKDAIILADAGNNMMFAERYFQTYFPRTFIADGAHTSMGASIPLSIGVKLGAPEKKVVAILGNGGFHMLCHEVVTAATYSIPVVWFILNDKALGCITHFCGKFGYGLWEPERYASTGPDLYDMDFVKFAEACQIYGERVEKPEEIRGALKRAFESGKPAIIDVMIDPDEIHPGAIYSYRKVLENYPGLLKKKIKRIKYPIEAIP